MDENRIVLTIGTFDILHYGHVAFLQECARLGSKLVVGVNTTEFVLKFKPEAPVMTYAERARAIHLQGYEVRRNTSAGRLLIEAVHPKVLAIGSDWARKDYLTQIGCTQDILDSLKVTLAYVPYDLNTEWPISSTEIKRRIREGR